jgi:hypothetical protein
MVTAPICMTKDQMAAGFAEGRSLTQEEWANPAEIQWIDELIAEGRATADPWAYHDNFQCQKRRVTGIALTVEKRVNQRSPNDIAVWPDGTWAELSAVWNGEYQSMSDDYEVVSSDDDARLKALGVDARDSTSSTAAA